MYRELKNKQFFHATIVLGTLFLVIVYFNKLKYGCHPANNEENLLAEHIFHNWQTNGWLHDSGIPVLEVEAAVENGKTVTLSPALSHPPFGYYVGYLFYLLLGNHWYWINYLLSFISSLLIYATVCLLCFHSFRSKLNIAGLFAFLIYLTNPYVLKTQMHVFHPNTLVQTEIIGLTYIAVKMIMRQRADSKKYFYSFAILNFIMAYTSWIGILFSFTIMLYGLVNLRKSYQFVNIVFISLFTTLCAVLLAGIQYSGTVGYAAYFHLMKANYLDETGVGNILSIQKYGKFYQALFQLVTYYFKAYWPIYLSMFVFVLFAITGKRKKIIFTKNGYRYLLISSLPVMMSHIVFMSYSITMPYSLLYALSFLSVLMGILFEKINQSKLFEPYIFYLLACIPLLAQLVYTSI